MQSWLTDDMRDLFRTVATLRDDQEVAAFMRDVATIKELDEMAKRWKAARLVDGGMPYREVSSETGLSTATVTRVAHWMKYGEGGYAAQLAAKDTKH